MRATSQAQAADTSADAAGDWGMSPVSEPEPVDADGDGVNDEGDFRPKDPKVQTRAELSRSGRALGASLRRDCDEAAPRRFHASTIKRCGMRPSTTQLHC